MAKARLFTPGPIEVPPEVSAAVGAPVFHHRTERFRQMLVKITEGLRQIIKTEHDVFTIGGSGTAGMEAALASACPAQKKVLVANNGKFAERWAITCRRYGMDVDEVTAPWGAAIGPDVIADRLSGGGYGAVVVVHSETSTGTVLELEGIARVVRESQAVLIADAITSCGAIPLWADKWGVDIVVCGSQKALMCPPGLAVVSVSPKAWAAMETTPPRGMYLDLREYRRRMKNIDTPYTPATTLLAGLHVAIERINAEGIENVWKRVARNAQATRAAAEAMGLKVFSQQPTDSLTALYYPEGIDDSFRKHLERRFGIAVAGGQNDLTGKIFRISHMGEADAVDTLGLLAAIGWCLRDKGLDVDVPAALSVASEILNP